MAFVGIILNKEREMYRHAQIDGNGIVVGISELSAIEVGRPELVYLQEDSPLYSEVTFGWRYIDGEWHEPLPPSEEELIENEIQEVNAQLRRMYDDEKYSVWLGTDNSIFQSVSSATIQATGFSAMNKEQLIRHMKELQEKLDEIKATH